MTSNDTNTAHEHSNVNTKHLLWLLLSIITFNRSAQADADSEGIDLAETALYDSGSPQRQSLLASNLDLQGSIGDRWDWHSNLSTTQIFFHPNATLQSKIQQNQYLLGGDFNQYSDLLQGKLSWQPLWIRIIGNDTYTLTQGQIGVMAWHFRPYTAPYRLTLDYTASRYSSGVTARQWHLQSILYSASRCDHLSLDLNTQQVSDPAHPHYWSAALSYQHVLRSDWLGMPYSLFVSILTGNQQYDVDSALAVIDNLPDIKQGALTAGARWLLGSQFSMGLQFSDSRYQSSSSATHYETPSITLDLAHPW